MSTDARTDEMQNRLQQAARLVADVDLPALSAAMHEARNHPNVTGEILDDIKDVLSLVNAAADFQGVVNEVLRARRSRRPVQK